MACSCEKGFASSYMLLKPEELGLFDLISILFSSDLEKRKFVDCPKGTVEESFRHRWLIFISVVVQKLLQFFAKPLAFLGYTIELSLNIISGNYNVFVLVLNFLRGNRTSAKFLSISGLVDKRVELDSSIKHDDSKYNAALSMMASKASYENAAFIETTVKDHWKMEFVGSYDFWNEFQEKATTQACILRDNSKDRDTYVVAFRGTEPFDADAWCSDFDLSWFGLPGVGRIHGGFMKALGLQKKLGWPKEIKEDNTHPPVAYYAIRDILKKHLSENDKAKFIVTGHSLGGALAILFPAVLFFHDEKLLLERLEGVYTFGQPRVGDGEFAEYMKQMLKENNIKYYRFVYCNDIVPRLPYDDKDLMFKHFGTCVYSNSLYEAKIVPEMPNKNYFSPLAARSMTMNAIWELIRSFIIVFKYGADYKEEWLMRFFRMFGLIVPGITAHLPPDYVNATRLGSALQHVD